MASRVGISEALGPRWPFLAKDEYDASFVIDDVNISPLIKLAFKIANRFDIDHKRLRYEL